MTRWKLVLEYDGAAFEGWQVQPGKRTISATIEDALERFLGHRAAVEGSGRTDAGVHALGQVAAFSTDVVRSEKAVRDGLNANLPDDVAVVDASVVAEDFDPRRATRSKTYRYTWLDRPSRSPLRLGRVCHVRRRLDDVAMDAAARHLVGRHDFSAFRAAGCGAKHPVRTVDRCAVRRDGDEVRLEVDGNGFLRHMVRIVAGTLLEVGQGRERPEWVADVLASRDRTRAGATAPAHGLTLVEVRYGSRSGPPNDESPDGDPPGLADDEGD